MARSARAHCGTGHSTVKKAPRLHVSSFPMPARGALRDARRGRADARLPRPRAHARLDRHVRALRPPVAPRPSRERRRGRRLPAPALVPRTHPRRRNVPGRTPRRERRPDRPSRGAQVPRERGVPLGARGGGVRGREAPRGAPPGTPAGLQVPVPLEDARAHAKPGRHDPGRPPTKGGEAPRDAGRDRQGKRRPRGERPSRLASLGR